LHTYEVASSVNIVLNLADFYVYLNSGLQVLEVVGRGGPDISVIQDIENLILSLIRL
jgi:hypothetical protein